MSVAIQLLSALLYLDSQGIVHRDINPANIVWSGSHATLIDFQTACVVTPSGPSGDTGTFPFQAPEMWGSSSYGTKVDVWALGLVLKHLLRAVETRKSAELQRLVEWCLQADPEARCSAKQVLALI
jgi:serine/threonine protein kinase